MIDKLHSFFFGDQLRKNIVLMSALFLGQITALPFIGQVQPSLYVVISICSSLLYAFLLADFYDRIKIRRQKLTESHSRRRVGRFVRATSLDMDTSDIGDRERTLSIAQSQLGIMKYLLEDIIIANERIFKGTNLKHDEIMNLLLEMAEDLDDLEHRWNERLERRGIIRRLGRSR